MTDASPDANLRETVPFLRVADMGASLRFYVDGLGFSVIQKWVDNGTIRWCWLKRGGAGLMLQDGRGAEGPPGLGVSILFICEDALVIYREATERGLSPQQPFVGNAMWVVPILDPDGYRVEFESTTDAAEGSVLEG